MENIADILRPEVLLVFLFAVVPGFVMVEVYSLLSPAPARDWSAQLVRLVSLSLLEVAFIAVPFGALVGASGDIPPALYGVLLWVFTVAAAIVIPAAAAFCAYRLRQNAARRGRFVPPSPTPFDRVFNELRGFYIRAHMKEGDTVAGYYGPESSVSTYPSAQQVYVEALYELTGDNLIGEAIPDSGGAIIDLTEVRLLEIVFPEERSQP